jgi:hypothetical protein
VRVQGMKLDPNALVTCQHIGCDAKYTEANNPVGCCVFHPGMVRGVASALQLPLCC